MEGSLSGQLGYTEGVILPDGFDQLVPDVRKQLVDCGVHSRQQALELVELLPTRDRADTLD